MFGGSFVASSPGHLGKCYNSKAMSLKCSVQVLDPLQVSPFLNFLFIFSRKILSDVILYQGSFYRNQNKVLVFIYLFS